MLRRLVERPAQILKSWYIAAFQVPMLPEFLLQRFSQQILQRPRAKTVVAPIKQYRAFVREIPLVLKSNATRLKCPVLVIWGKDDPWLLPPTQDELEVDATQVEIRILSGSHWLHQNRSSDVNQLIKEFAEKVTNGGSL
jgi:pimeloyl-ACP methyl ester carboxylesterase